MSRRRPSKADRVLERANKAIAAADDAVSRELEPEEVAEFADKLENDYFARWHSEDSVLTALDNMEARSGAQRSSARQRRGVINKKTQFLVWAIDLAFDDFGQWWADRSDRPASWRYERIIQHLNEQALSLISSLPQHLVGLELDQGEGGSLLIKGKRVTPSNIKSVIPHLVTDR